MALFGKHLLIGFPEVAISETSALCRRHLVAWSATTLFAAVPAHKGRVHKGRVHKGKDLKIFWRNRYSLQR